MVETLILIAVLLLVAFALGMNVVLLNVAIRALMRPPRRPQGPFEIT
jgi:hypothetical protein